MILKLKREGSPRGQEWWILDGIRKISVSKVLEAPVDGEEKALNEFWGQFDLTIMDMVDKDVPNCAGAKYKMLICRLVDGTEYTIMFDTVAYLCNDEGKTIERILVN